MVSVESARTVVVVPGRMFGPHVPLLMYASAAAEVRSARLHPITWAPPEDLPDDARGEWVTAQVAPVLDAIATGGGSSIMIVAKSLGTYAAALAAERAMPAIWLTPILTDPWIVDALGRATAPFLLVGGTADEAWNDDVATKLTPHVLAIDGADHGMFVPGPLAGSAEVLGQVVMAVEDFLDRVVWTESAH